MHEVTVKDCILLHLLEHHRTSDEYVVPLAVTQSGIADAVGINIHHVSQYVRPLKGEGKVSERTAHIRGGGRRRKAYHLTDKGKLVAYRLREALKGEVVRVRESEGIREALIAELLEETAERIPIVDILRHIRHKDTVDLTSLVHEASTRLVEMSADAPSVEGFVGRERELKVLTTGEDPQVFVVRGVSGIGKSTLAAMLCETQRDSRHIFWHRIRMWDTLRSVLAHLGRFLSALGRPGLAATLTEEGPDMAPQILREDLPGSPLLLIFDDAHEASSEVLSFLSFLKEALRETTEAKALVLTRAALSFYDRRDVLVDRLVYELDLEGLSDSEVASFVSREGNSEDIIRLSRHVGGHPLLLSLLRSTCADKPHDAIQGIEAFLEETIYRALNKEERKMAKLASMYEVPVPEKALFADDRLTIDILHGLRDKGLVLEIGEREIGVHDAVREFFAGRVTPEERVSYSRIAVSQLRQLADLARERGDPSAALDSLSNALKLAPDSGDHMVVLEELADAKEQVGDLLGSLVVYAELLRHAKDDENRARIHRKRGSVYFMQGEIRKAKAELEEGYQVLGELSGEERGWLELVNCKLERRLEEWEEARDHGRIALQIFKAVGETFGQALAFLELGNIETEAWHGDPGMAEEYLSAALAFQESVGDPEFTATVHTVLAHLYEYRHGDAEKAFEHIRAIEEIPQTIGDLHRTRSLLMLKGWIELELRADYSSAERHFEEALALAKRMHRRSTVLFARYGLSLSAYYRGEFEEAGRELEDIASGLRSLGMVIPAIETLWKAAECALIQGDIARFERLADALTEEDLVRGAEVHRAERYTMEGLKAILGGNAQNARSHFAAAMEASETSIHSDRVRPHVVFSAVMDLTGNHEESSQLLRRLRGLLQPLSRKAELSSMEFRHGLLCKSLAKATYR